MENNKIARNGNQLQLSELYFLISKFLKNGPLQNAAKVVVEAMEKHKILPKRMDWLGNEHDQSFEELESKYPHISPNHLFEICLRIGPILDKELNPSVPGVLSLLGAGKQSLLRTNETINRPKALRDYSTRLHGMPVLDVPHRKNPDNIVNVLYGRELSGPIIRKQAISTNFYTKQTLLRRTLGHLSAVYCVLFDRSGNYIITGADDLLVKLWSAIDGRLLLTFRGASAEITDIATNLDNTLLAAGSLDRILRVWDLQTGGPIAVLSSHTGMITSVNFCPQPKGDIKYLVTTSTDGTVAFWQYTTPRCAKPNFASKPIQYHEKIRPGQAQMICASYSPGGIFLAAGSADHHVRVYIMAEEGPKRILEIEAHTDTVDSIQWAHSGLQFISGSKDGIALVWHFESQQWKSMKLNMSERLPSCPAIPDDEVKRLKVTMVSWDYTDKWIITAVNDFTIKVWNALTGKLHKVMRGHTDELYVLESNPKDPHVLISAGHDGQMFIWDIYEGVPLANFINHIDGQGHGGVFDAKWSPDGSMIAATDSHGHILMYGVGTGHDRLRMLPRELFFHTDYRPLIRDSNHFVMDEQTQTMPHLMPPPFLVDVDGNPYPPALQRLVPGRENCTNEQLIPNIAVGPEGVEVIEGAAAGMAVSEIDRLIAALANRSGQPDPNNDRENLLNNLNNNRAYYSPRMSGSRVGLRRTGDLEGVRLSSGNWQHEHNYKWMRRTFIAPLHYSHLQSSRQTAYVTGQQELELYRREMRRRPVMINTGNISLATARPPARRGRHGPNAISENSLIAHRTRARREQETRVQPNDEHDDPDNIASPSSDSDDSSDLTADIIGSGSSSSETDSSDYSDWVAADQPGNTLEPPKRLKRKPVHHVHHRVYTQANNNNNNNNSNTSNNSNNHNNNNENNDMENVTENGEGNKRGRKKLPVPVPENGEIPEAYRPPEWLSEVIPRKAPYYPQMGDEVVYFRQGHQRYLEAVRNKNVYKLSNNIEPWHNLDLREHELVKVIGIKYEIRPPRLCCLKLALISNDGVLTAHSFTIKYHDIPDVLDFIVLRQTYDTAVRRLWTPGDRFRCMIDDGWWMGLIESRVALSSDFPNSLFMCFRIRWDNGEYEFMSPWDMEPIDQQRLPAEVGGAVPVLPEELRQTLYQPKQEEWPRGDRDASCRRIVSGLEEVMGLAIAEPFLAPVDLNCYPTYAFVVEYPIDLATIKSRFENHFYRRITSAQFDVRYLATNAEKFNESRSNIVRHARIITDLCLRIIKDHNEVNVQAVYHQLVDTYTDSDSDNDQTDGAGPSTSSGIGGASRAVTRSNRLKPDYNWRIKCRELLEMIYSCNDSSPFRNPVDIIEHPDYTQIVDTPMDLHTVKEDLLGGNYESPIEFAKDMRLIFTNSRNYNTNKRSKKKQPDNLIYSMTIRLSALFETHIKQLIQDWKSTKHNSPKKTPVNAVDRPGSSKMATRAKAATTATSSSTTTTTTIAATTTTNSTTTNVKSKPKVAKPKQKPKRKRRRRTPSPPARPWARHTIFTVHAGFPWEDQNSAEFIRDHRARLFDPTRPIQEQLEETDEESAEEPDDVEDEEEDEEEEEEGDEGEEAINDDDDDDDDDDNVHLANSQNRSRGRPSKHNQSNGVSSSSAYLNTQPSTSHYARMQATRAQQSRHNNHNNSTSTNNSDSSTDSSTSETNSDDDSDESHGIPITSLGMSSRQRKRPARHSDSEDSYKPNKRTMGKPKKRGRKKQRKNKDNRHNKGSPVNDNNGSRTPLRSNSTMLGRPRIGRPPLNRQHQQSERSNAPTTPVRSAASGRLRMNDADDLNYRDLPNDTNEQQQQQTPTKRRRGRPKRHYTRVSDESNSSGRPQKKTRRRYGKFNENEHNLSNNSNNNIQSDMDEDGQPLRPTRSSRRRPLWNDDDDEEEDDEDNEVDVDNDNEQDDEQRFDGRRRIAQPQQLSSHERLRNRQRGIQSAGRTPEQNQESSHNGTAINNPYRPIRSSTRQHRQSPDDSDDDRTLSQISLDSRTRRNFHSTTVLNGISEEIPITSRTITQTTITGLSSESRSSSSSSTTRLRTQVPRIEDDNDYGEPGPSSLRNTATHELVDPIGSGSGMDLLSQPLTNNISGRLRHRNHVNMNSTTGMGSVTATITTTPTKGDKRRRYLQNAYTDEDENEEDPLPSANEMDKQNSDNDNDDNDDDDDDDDDEDNDDNNNDDDDYDTEDVNLKNIVDQIDNGGEEGDNPTSEDTSDPEDNKPLRYVATSTRAKQTSEYHNTRSGRRTTKKPNVYMDNDDDDDYENGNNNDDDDDDDYLDDGDDDDEEYNNTHNNNSNNHNHNRNGRRPRGTRVGGGGGGSAALSSSRSTRIQKRPYYNEESDDENPAPTTLNTHKKRLMDDTYVDGGTSSSSRSRTATTTLTMLTTTTSTTTGATQPISNHNIRNQRSTSNSNNTIDDENSDNEQLLSVSSRGRVRKITAKARGLFRE